MATHGVSLSSSESEGEQGPRRRREAGRAGLEAPPPDFLALSPHQQRLVEESLLEEVRRHLGPGAEDHRDVPTLAEFIRAVLRQGATAEVLQQELKDILPGDGLVTAIFRRVRMAAQQPPLPVKAAPRARPPPPKPAPPLREARAAPPAAPPPPIAPPLDGAGRVEHAGRAPAERPPGPGRARERSRSRGSSHGALPANLQQLSKILCGILRHTADRRGINIASDGYAPLLEVMSVLYPTWAIEQVLEVVRLSRHRDGAPRFQILDQDGRQAIRATRHHTLPRVNPAAADRAAPLPMAAVAVPRLLAPRRNDHGGGRHRDRDPHLKLSKELCRVLRHTAVRDGVAVARDGFAPVGEVLGVVRVPADEADVEELVETSLYPDGSARFELRRREDGLWIRTVR